VLTAKGHNTVEVPNVLLGDVWLCSGQSNMTMGMGNYTKETEMVADIAAADLPLVRQFGAEKVFAPAPRTNVEGEWLVCNPHTASRFSAVAFYFARKLQAETGVPIGILRSAAGGTVIECWLSQETYFDTPALGPIAKKMRESLAAWETDKQAAIKAGKSPDALDFPPYPFGEKVRRPLHRLPPRRSIGGR
jgi:sialate O-acetylesterase